jgi:ribosome assembly protein YihI (activator of Der GTPase)
MQARREFRDRPDTEVAVLDALVDRQDAGMTVLELRAHVDADIDGIEDALTSLNEAGLIHATDDGSRTRIAVDDAVVPDGDHEPEYTLVDRIREKLKL